MKVTINVECTPDEARRFMGLPDVAPLQEEMMAKLKAQMEQAAAAMGPEAIMKSIFPNVEGLTEIQKAFWGQFTGTKS